MTLYEEGVLEPSDRSLYSKNIDRFRYGWTGLVQIAGVRGGDARKRNEK